MGVLNELIHSFMNHKSKKRHYHNCLHDIRIEKRRLKKLQCLLNNKYNEISRNKNNWFILKDKLDYLDKLLDKILEINNELKQLKKDKKKFTQKLINEKSKCQVLSKCIYYVLNV